MLNLYDYREKQFYKNTKGFMCYLYEWVASQDLGELGEQWNIYTRVGVPN